MSESDRESGRPEQEQSAETRLLDDDASVTGHAETRVLADDEPALEEGGAEVADSATGDETQFIRSDSPTASREDTETSVIASDPPAAAAPPLRTRESDEIDHVDDDAPTRFDRHAESSASKHREPDEEIDADIGADAETRVARREQKTRPPTDSSSQELAPGSVLFGEYEIVDVLGVGGMGQVYRARHRRLDEYRAIKVMNPDMDSRLGAAEFFDREAKALLAVRHPAVVHCHDLLSDPAGRVYLVMEMIEGIPLSKRMNEGPLSADDVMTLGARVAAGLAAAHECGVIHRDISPDNIVLPDGEVANAKLIDFGIAKLLESGEGTIVDGFKGKLFFASPEQMGFFGNKIDGRSDIYSLGLVLVAAALGRPLGMGTTLMEAVEARRNLTELPAELPAALRSAIGPLLALDPDDRPDHVEQFLAQPTPSPAREIEADDRELTPPARAGNSGLFVGLTLAGAAAATAFLLLRPPVPQASSPAVEIEMTRVVAPQVGDPSETLTPPPAIPTDPADETDLTNLGRQPTAADPANHEAGSPEETATTAIEPMQGGAVLAPTPALSQTETTPSPAKAKPISALDRVRVMGFLRGGDVALAEDRLTSPEGDNAYEKYRAVLEIDPSNAKANQGIRKVAGRYLDMAETAISQNDLDRVDSLLEQAKKVDSTHPRLASVSALASASRP
jgi:serine/threonine protein kinase